MCGAPSSTHLHANPCWERSRATSSYLRFLGAGDAACGVQVTQASVPATRGAAHTPFSGESANTAAALARFWAPFFGFAGVGS